MKTVVVYVETGLAGAGKVGKIDRMYEGAPDQAKFGSDYSNPKVTSHIAIPENWDIRAVKIRMRTQRWVSGSTIVYEDPNNSSYVLETGSFAEAYEDQDVKAALLSDDAKAYGASLVKAARQFGLKVIDEFAGENVMMGITQDGKTEEILNKMQAVVTSLQTGSLYVARDKVLAFPQEMKDAKYITNARLLAFVNKIEEYLKIPLTTSMP